MDEQQVFGTMWSMGFGNMNDVLFGEGAVPQPRVRAIRSDWETHRMPTASGNGTSRLLSRNNE